MKKVYIGIDAHKESNVVALAFAGHEEPELYGKASADLKAFEAVLRRIMKKYDLSRSTIYPKRISRCVMRRGLRGSCWRGDSLSWTSSALWSRRRKSQPSPATE